MKDQAEELHRESLELLAKLASSKLPCESENFAYNRSPSKACKLRKNICKGCQQLNCSEQCDKENMPHINIKNTEEVTPKKDINNLNEPLTPTANLKMLVCAASVLTPANSMEEEKRQLFVNDILPKPENNFIQSENKQAKKGQLLGRKEKSLGLLCKRFMMIYPEYSPSGTTILLDDVVKSLGIGRRRVYDIVNVLESMEMMVRQAKNKYLWYGKSRLPATLTKLKALALRVYGKSLNNNNYKTQYQPILPKDIPRNPLTVLTNAQVQFQIPTSTIVPLDDSGASDNSVNNQENKEISEVDEFTSSIMDYIISCDTRKESSRSLGILCQKFLMLFMVAEDSIVTLDRAAKILINEHEEGPSKYKTKVRRLYDIANILTSIKFLEKTTSYENATKKAAYKWVGIDLKSLDSEEDIKQAFQSLEFSATRHSLLSNVPRVPSDFNTNRKLQCRSASAHQLTSPGSILENSGKLKFPRTFSATTAPKEIFEDGFDIDQISEQSSEDMVSSEGAGGESPNQALFKEKLRNLQKEFPDKLSNNGLIELLSSANNPLAALAKPVKPRRSLSNDFNNDTVCLPAKKIKLDESTTEAYSDQEKLEEPAASLVALKPLLSYGGDQQQQNCKTQSVSKQLTAVTSTKNLPKYLPLQVATNNLQSGQSTVIPQHTSVTNRLCQPILVSAVGNPMSLQKGGGLYQIIPLQCKPMNKNDKPIPVFIGQQQLQQGSQCPANISSSNVVTMLMRPPIVTVTSPSVLLSPRNATVTSQISDKYPEYFTPPHPFFNGANGKPPANPIIFPKMTPETPTSDPKSVLTAVTRKLMSLQNDESA